MPEQKTAKKSRERRAQILRAGYAVATRVGLSGLTVRLVATKARLSSGLVLFYFKTKDRLLSAVLIDLLKPSAVRRAPTRKGRHESPDARLVSLIRGETRRTLSDPRRVRLLFGYFVMGFRDPLIRARMRVALQRYREAFQPAAKAVLSAEPRRFRHASADGLAAVAAGVVEGGAVQSAIDPAHFNVGKYLAAAQSVLTPRRTGKKR
jgi:TetR/AcrR family transcriptional repressor of bet genes